MVGRVVHIGLTVSNLEESIDFYENTLGLNLQGQMLMKGESTDKLFNIQDCKVKVAYLNGSKEINTPPIELLEFSPESEIDKEIILNKTSISEVCFGVEDIYSIYKRLLDKDVKFLSEPQFFDLREQGYGKSKAVYFKDPDGINLELIETIKE